MNLNINYSPEENEIVGYINVSLKNKTYLQDIKDLPVESCDNVIISDALNRVDKEKALEILNECCSRLAINGKISIQILDLKYLSVSVISGSLDSKSINDIIGTTQCILGISDIKDALNKHRITLVSHSIKHMTTLVDGVKNEVS